MRGWGIKRIFIMATKKTASKKPVKEAKEVKKETKTVTKTKISPTQKLINAEEKRIIKYLKNKAIDEDKLNIALDLVKDIAYMTVKTADLKKDVDAYGMVEEYQNGANQRGRKKSAAFEAYLNMTKQKSALIKQLTDLLPVDESYNPSTPADSKDEFDEFLKVRSRKNE